MELETHQESGSVLTMKKQDIAALIIIFIAVSFAVLIHYFMP